jgi:hypothetical protein
MAITRTTLKMGVTGRISASIVMRMFIAGNFLETIWKGYRDEVNMSLRMRNGAPETRQVQTRALSEKN